MEWLQQAADALRNETGVVLSSTVERLAVAALLGGLIGLEREFRHKPAGLRTNMLICLGAAMFTVLSVELGQKFGGDHVRIASQIIPGIGFIGAGAILRDRGSVTGLTTAATVFVAASVGMAAGGGLYVTAVFSTVVIIALLKVMGVLEQHFEKKHLRTTFEIFGPSAEATLEEVHRILAERSLVMQDVHAATVDGKSRVVFAVDGIGPGDHTLSIRLHQSSLFSSVQSLGTTGPE